MQERAIRNLEESLAAGRPKALVQMATGSGKAFMACNQVYRLIKHAGARRVLFLEYIEENRDEITALQVLYERPYRQWLSYAGIKALADALVSPPRSWTTERLWEPYRQHDKSKGARVPASGPWPISCLWFVTPLVVRTSLLPSTTVCANASRVG